MGGRGSFGCGAQGSFLPIKQVESAESRGFPADFIFGRLVLVNGGSVAMVIVVVWCVVVVSMPTASVLCLSKSDLPPSCHRPTATTASTPPPLILLSTTVTAIAVQQPPPLYRKRYASMIVTTTTPTPQITATYQPIPTKRPLLLPNRRSFTPPSPFLPPQHPTQDSYEGLNYEGDVSVPPPSLLLSSSLFSLSLSSLFRFTTLIWSHLV